MKREERNTLNALRKSINPGTINVEVPTTYTKEGRQEIHHMLTLEKGFIAVRIYWNDITKSTAVHYIPAADHQQKERQRQEIADIDELTASLPDASSWTWNGYRRPDAAPGPDTDPDGPGTEKQPTKPRKKSVKGYDIKKLFDIVDAAIKSDRAAFHEPRDNSKLRGIPAFNLAPGRTCSPEACAHCLREGCYAVKNACCHGYDIESNNCLRAWTENTALAMNHVKQLEKAIDAWLTKRRPALFRIHSAGDFFSIEYARMWRRVAARHPETRFLVFTKQFDIVRHVHFYKVPNFELVLSGWTGVSVPEDLRKRYRVAWCNDGQETRIPADAIHCPGDCNHCRACWYLSIMGKDSFFDKH